MDALLNQLHDRAASEEIRAQRSNVMPLATEPPGIEPLLDEKSAFIQSWRRSVGCQVYKSTNSWHLYVRLRLKTRAPDVPFVRWYEVSFDEITMFRDVAWIEMEVPRIMDAWISWLARKVVKAT